MAKLKTSAESFDAAGYVALWEGCGCEMRWIRNGRHGRDGLYTFYSDATADEPDLAELYRYAAMKKADPGWTVKVIEHLKARGQAAGEPMPPDATTKDRPMFHVDAMLAVSRRTMPGLRQAFRALAAGEDTIITAKGNRISNGAAQKLLGEVCDLLAADDAAMPVDTCQALGLPAGNTYAQGAARALGKAVD